MENETITPLSVEIVKGLGFEKIKPGVYSNGKFDLKYSDYGMAYTERCSIVFPVYCKEALELLCSMDDKELFDIVNG